MAKEWSLKRPKSIPLRLTPNEKKLLTSRARATGLSLVEYARRKIFDMPVSPAFNPKTELLKPSKAT